MALYMSIKLKKHLKPTINKDSSQEVKAYRYLLWFSELGWKYYINFLNSLTTSVLKFDVNFSIEES